MGSKKSCFGRRLRQARECFGIPQDRLGVLIGLDEGCSSARISRYETGIHAPPFEVAQKIARVLGVPEPFFYCEDDGLASIILRVNKLSDTERTHLDEYLNRFDCQSDLALQILLKSKDP
ncbi:MAG: helix-turn-helix domain-containing protein [Methylococcaceae bacterium]